MKPYGIEVFPNGTIKEGIDMLKGYPTDNGYKGYVEGEGYILFETEEAYYEYMEAIKC